jgi:hypothetical protein
VEKRAPDLIVQGVFDYLHNQIEIAFKVFNNIFIKVEAMRDITKIILPRVMNTVMSMTDE